MKFTVPTLVDSDSKNNITIIGLMMMEEDKTIFIGEGANDLKAIYVNDNTKFVQDAVDNLMKESSYTAMINKLSPSFNISPYAFLAIENLLTGRPGDASLLVLDIEQAIKENFIYLKDNTITVRHLELMYSDGFYSLDGYKQRIEELKNN